MYLLVKASSLDKQMPTRGRVAPGEDASPAGKGTLSAGEGTLSAGEDALYAHLYIYCLEFLIDLSTLHTPFKEIDMVNCTLE